MKKILFISNITKKITNFSIPSIIASQRLGYEFHLAANLSNFKDDPSKYNIKVHHIDLVRNPFDLLNIKAYKQLLTLIRKEKYDVIHCNTPIGGLLGRLCGKKAKVPKIIYTAHGFHFYKGAPLINRTLFKFIEMWLARFTDAIITINQEDFQTANYLKLRKKGTIYYIPGVGVDTLPIRNALPKREELLNEIRANKESILIISIGELNRNKNNKVIIEALGKLQNSNIHYLICGIGEEQQELLSLSEEYNIQENVHFLGYRNDIPQLLKSSDIFIMPSYREGLSRSIMEAMSAGLPCVVSKIRGNVDLIEEEKGGFLLSPSDVQNFAKYINILVMDQTLRRNMGLYNLQKVKSFDVESVKLKMKKIYKEVLMDEKSEI
jgi:glycosyltransferase involved in cell wall biosynthesis